MAEILRLKVRVERVAAQLERLSEVLQARPYTSRKPLKAKEDFPRFEGLSHRLKCNSRVRCLEAPEVFELLHSCRSRWQIRSKKRAEESRGRRRNWNRRICPVVSEFGMSKQSVVHLYVMKLRGDPPQARVNPKVEKHSGELQSFLLASSRS